MAASYREVAAGPRLVLTVRSRLAYPVVHVAFWALWVVLAGLAAVLPAHLGVFDVAVLGVLGVLGALLAWATAGALLNRAVLTVTGTAIDVHVAPLPWSGRRPRLLDVVGVDAVQRREEDMDGDRGAAAHTLRVHTAGGRSVELLQSFSLSEQEAAYLALRIGERLSSVRVEAPDDVVVEAEDEDHVARERELRSQR